MERYTLNERKRACARFFYGFTLMELVIGVLLLSILLFLAIPAMSRYMADSHLFADLNKLQSLLALARMESVKSGEKVVLCRWDGNLGCTGASQSGTQQWNNGALIFMDKNGDRQISTKDYVIKVISFSPENSVTWNRGETLVYESDGSVYGASNGTFQISQGDDIKKLVISMTGRVRRTSN
ncbi:GspH/FimT family pseudopilin [Neptuniibacter caesariensis]|uniref:Type II secretion system protein H n=1 Tax=Neptuniibacter caesariensis TaxID=207954 RepID=A0A7U8C595_NEPCE|nr:GspH/FimT family pseudopilin [Neptuniibacter caesariensis]EAR61469.1 putative type IV pilus biogenesis protein [Oceanospirillum sp. MED92] [Neptuniibacter caesariensis]